MKEYIDISESNGKVKKAEVILRFHEQENNNYYIIYKYNNEYFAAKYDDVVGISKLDTNLTTDELNQLEKLLNEMGI